MLGAMARAGAVLGEETYRAAAEKNLAFLKAKLWDARTKTLYHRWRDGERDNVQLLEGYAFLLAGVIELYEATLEAEHLDFAIALAEAMLARFYDAENGGFWQSAAGREGPDPARQRGLRRRGAFRQFGGHPGVAEAWQDHRPQGLHAGGREEPAPVRQPAAEVPRLCPTCCRRWISRSTNPGAPWSRAIPAAPRRRALLRAIHSVYQPNKVVLGNTGPVEPFAQTLPVQRGPVVYLCSGTACQAPTSEPARVKELLAARAPAGGP